MQKLKVSDGEAKEMLLKWFHSTNCPATTQAAVDGLGSKVSKITVVRCLEAMKDDGALGTKDFKKIRLYFLPQNSSSSSSSSSNDSSQSPVTWREVSKTHSDVSGRLKAAQITSSRLRCLLSAEEGKLRLGAAQSALLAAQQCLQMSGGQCLSPEQVRHVVKQYQWSQRVAKDRRSLFESAIFEIGHEQPPGGMRLQDQIGISDLVHESSTTEVALPRV